MILNTIDIIIIILYFAIIFITGFILTRRWKSNRENNYEDYLLAGRKVTLPLFVATLVATWYGNILGVGEFVYKNGLVAWVCFIFPYYIAAALYAYFISKKIRMSDAKTIPEQMTNCYDSTTGWISSLIILIITIPAAYFLMLGIIIQIFCGWNLWLCILLGAVFSLSYIYKGGLKADILTNAAQFIIMYIGFGLLLIFSIIHFGSPVNLINHLPESHKTLFGNSSWQYILAWFIIALQTFIDPSFHQRASAAKSPQIAQKGVLISIACWVVFDTFTLLTGFYAKAYFQIDNPVMAYPILGDAVLPHLFKGIFVASLLATIMSTLDSYALISAATIGNDILGKFRRSKFYNIDVENSSSIKFGLILTGLIGISMAVVIPSIIELVYKTASIAVPALLIPLIVSYSQKFYLKAKKARLMMLISGGLSFLFTIYDILLEKTGNLVQDRLFNIEPMMPGIIISFILGLFFIKRK